MKKRVLITKEASEVEDLHQFCEKHEFQLIAQTFISFQGKEFTVPTENQILFFGSKRGFDFYRKQSEIKSETILACVGKATADHIHNKGFKTNFIGEKSSDPKAVSLQLKKWLNGRKITFVYSNQSSKQVASALESKQYKEIVVYQTVPTPVQLEIQPEVLVFTSPSNVRSFLEVNQVAQDAHVIAWGESTAKELVLAQVNSHFTMKEAAKSELMDYLKTYAST